LACPSKSNRFIAVAIGDNASVRPATRPQLTSRCTTSTPPSWIDLHRGSSPATARWSEFEEHATAWFHRDTVLLLSVYCAHRSESNKIPSYERNHAALHRHPVRDHGLVAVGWDAMVVSRDVMCVPAPHSWRHAEKLRHKRKSPRKGASSLLARQRVSCAFVVPFRVQLDRVLTEPMLKVQGHSPCRGMTGHKQP